MQSDSSVVSDAFICALLDPLPEGVPVDTNYNALMRQARRMPWRRAKAEADFCRAAVVFHRAAATRAIVANRHDEFVEHRDHGTRWLERARHAEGDLILTPAPTQADVEHKRKLAKDRYLPLRTVEVEAAIAADEGFFAAHPTTAQPRRKRA